MIDKIIKLLIILTGSICLLSGAFALNTDGLEAHWKLEDLTDSSGNGYTLTNNGATSSSSCSDGNCYNFDGTNDHMQTGVTQTGDTTLSAWIYTDNTDKYQAIMSSDSTDYFRMIVDTRSSTERFRILSHDGGTNNDLYVNFADSKNPENTWTHVVAVYDDTNNQLRFYVDGTLEGTLTSANNVLTTVNEYLIGLDTANYFDGKIDEVSIWNYALTDTNVSSLYSNGIEYDSGVTPTIQTNISNFYNTQNISIQLNTTTNTNMSYSLDNGTLTSICNDCNNSILNLNGLSESLHNLVLVSDDENGQTNNSISFTIDLTNPIESNNIPLEINSNVLDNISINITELNEGTCTLIFSDNSSQYCSTTSKTFTTFGNYTFKVNVTDLAGNNVINNYSLYVNPYQYFYFKDLSNNPLSNFTFNNVLFQNYSKFKLFDLNIGENNLEFSKFGYARTNVSFNLTNTSLTNLTTSIKIAKLTINIKDLETKSDKK